MQGSRRKTGGVSTSNFVGNALSKRNKADINLAAVVQSATNLKLPEDFIGKIVEVHLTDGNRIIKELQDVMVAGMNAYGMVVHMEYRKKPRAVLIPWTHAVQIISDSGNSLTANDDEPEHAQVSSLPVVSRQLTDDDTSDDNIAWGADDD